jgi:hypothetical protein
VAGAVLVVGGGQPVEMHQVRGDREHGGRLGAIGVDVVAVRGHLGQHGRVGRPPVDDPHPQVRAEQAQLVGGRAQCRPVAQMGR